MMKRIITILFISIIAFPIIAQNKFAIPLLTDLQKYRNAALQWNGSYLIQISYAKSLGKSVEDAATFFGDQLKITWNKAGGFDSYVQSMLYTMVSLVPYGSVEISEQTENSLIYKVLGLYSELKEGGSVFDVTYEEYIKFLGTAFSRIADYMGAIYLQQDTDDGLIVTIKKK